MIPKLHLSDVEEILDNGCQEPGCTHQDHDTIFVHPKCHPGGGVEVCFKRGETCLFISCRVCHAPIVAVEIAEDVL